MGTHGEYAYNDYTLLNILQNYNDLKSTSYHEYTHLVLTRSSSIGLMIYCLEKIKIPKDNSDDQQKYEALTGFLNNHTNKVQEGVAVFIQCIALLLQGDSDACETFLHNLKNNNRMYYRHVEPLIFIIRILENETDKNVILNVSHLVFLLGVECMNCKIYELNPKEFISNKMIQKIVSTENFGKKYLPDKKFISNIKYCKMKQVKTAKELEEYILPLISKETFTMDIERDKGRLEKVKGFIMEFFEDSEYINAYKKKMDTINIKSERVIDLYLQQLPTIFNKEEMKKMVRKATTEEIQKEIKEETTIIFLLGSLKDNFELLKGKVGLTNEWMYDKAYFETYEMLQTYNLKDRRILTLLEKTDKIQKMLSQPGRKATVVTAYKNYDYDNDSIKGHNLDGERIYIYCDRTYPNVRVYLNKWKDRKVYCNTMEYENMEVLILKIASNRYFILPMTSIAAEVAYLDMKNTYKNINCTLKEGAFYDDQVIVSEKIRNDIDSIINGLVFM